MEHVVAGALLLLGVVLRFAPPGRRRARARPELTPALAGMLAGGPERALRAALVTMRRRGEIGVAKAGVLRRAGTLSATGDPLERTVYRVLGDPAGPRAIHAHRRTIEAFDALRRDLVAHGLLLATVRWWLLALLSVAALGLCVAGAVGGDLVVPGVLATLAVANLLLPRHTVAGWRLLRALRRTHPVPQEGAARPGATTTGVVVAVHGTLDLPGLRGFARRGGLLDGGSPTSSRYEDPALDDPSVPLSADPDRRPRPLSPPG